MPRSPRRSPGRSPRSPPSPRGWSRPAPWQLAATRSRSRSPLARDPSGGGGGAASSGGGGAAVAASLLRIHIQNGIVTFKDDNALREGAQVVLETEPNSSGETIRTIRAYAEVGPIRWT